MIAADLLKPRKKRRGGQKMAGPMRSVEIGSDYADIRDDYPSETATVAELARRFDMSISHIWNALEAFEKAREAD
jgi:hypothetical protein